MVFICSRPRVGGMTQFSPNKFKFNISQLFDKTQTRNRPAYVTPVDSEIAPAKDQLSPKGIVGHCFIPSLAVDSSVKVVHRVAFVPSTEFCLPFENVEQQWTRERFRPVDVAPAASEVHATKNQLLPTKEIVGQFQTQISSFIPSPAASFSATEPSGLARAPSAGTCPRFDVTRRRILVTDSAAATASAASTAVETAEEGLSSVGRRSLVGQRSAEEAVGFFAASLRRRWGIVAAREYARLRLNRLSYVRAAPGARSGQLCSASGDADGTHCLFSAEAFRAGIRAY